MQQSGFQVPRPHLLTLDSGIDVQLACWLLISICHLPQPVRGQQILITGSRVVSVLDSGAEGPRFKSQSDNSLRQTVHTHCASVHQATKLVAALLRVVGVTAGLAESNGSLPPGLWLTSPAGWLSRTGISSGTLRSVIEDGLPLPF